MALRALNSIGGFSVGDNPQQSIILANGDITSNNITANGTANINGNLTANFANFSGNVSISNATASWGLFTDNLYYSNGAPWDMSNPAGSNGYIQYYDDGAFGASANFQFTASTNTLQVTGTANVTGNLNVSDTIGGNIANFSGNLTALNANLGNLATANYVNIATQLNGNIGNFSGNLKAANANLGNLVTANYANIANDLVVQGNIANANNVSITNDLQGNTANFSGNIVSLNANLGNLASANFVNVSSNLNVTNTANVGNLNVNGNVTSNLIPNVSNTYTLGNATNMWKDLYLSGTTIYIGSQNITANGTAIAVSNDFAANNLVATSNIYANSGGGAGYIYANFANVNSNLYVGGNANIVSTLTAANIKDTNLANTQIVYANASNTLTGSSNFVFDDTSNTLTVTGNANVSSYLNGNIANFSGNLTSLNANLGNLATANYVNVTNQLNGNIGNFSGNVTAANFITSGTGGNISGANVVSSNSYVTQGGTVNFTNSSNVALGAVGNLHITGGSDGYVLTTDGTGNVSWSETAATNSIFNGNSNVAIPVANGNVTITANAGTAYTWTFANTNGSFNAPGDGSFAGAVGANSITANWNITANGNVYANAGGGNGYIYANYANVQSDLYVGASANIVNTLTANVANITTLNVANISTTGNITANNATINLELAGNTANFSGNVKFSGAEANIANALYVGTNANIGGNLNVVGNIANANNISVTNNISVGSANITNLLQGNTANFTGNVNALNFIGNLANGASNVRIDNGGNITFSPGTGYGNAVTISSGGLETIGYFTANGNITSNTGIVSNNVTAFANTQLTLSAGAATGTANINVSLVPTGNGTVDVNSKRITNLATPSLATDAATKQYVDDVAQGLNVHDAANVATTGTLTSLTGGGTITYNNGTSGVGATLTLSGTYSKNFTAADTFDTGFTATTTNRILVRAESNPAYNGVYVVSSSTVLTRADDYNTVPEVEAGDFIFVIAGDTYEASGWVQTSVVTTIGTSPINFTQFSGAGAYTANTAAGLQLDGTVFSAKVDGNANPTIGFDGNGNLYVPSGAHFTTPDVGAATGTSIDLTGNVLAQNLNANALITTANIQISGNTLTNNLTANVNITATGNLSGNNANVTNLLTVGGNANITGNITANVANFSGNLTSLNANLGNLATANYVNVATQINGNIANFSGNLTAANANLGNLATANYVNVANDLNVTGTANIANISMTGNLTANNVTSNNAILAQSANIGNTSIQWANVTTNSTAANQTIAEYTISSTDIVGIEFLVKSYDTTTPGDTKYSVATVQAVTNGSTVDYAIFGTVRLGNTTGSLAVSVPSVMGVSKVQLQATPATGNTTVWTTQYRLI